MKYITYLLASISLIFSMQVSAQLPEQPHLVVRAEASESVLPNMVTVNLTIENISPILNKARKNVEQRSKQLLKEIRRFNLSSKDTEAGQIRIQPEYEWQKNKRVQVGTRVSRSMSFIVRDLSVYPDLLDAITSVSVDSLAQVTFGHSDEDKLQAKALDQAIINAKSKAQRMAQQLGQRISRAYSIEEIGQIRPMHQAMAKGMMADSAGGSTADYQPGEISFSSEVRIVFYLQ